MAQQRSIVGSKRGRVDTTHHIAVQETLFPHLKVALACIFIIHRFSHVLTGPQSLVLLQFAFHATMLRLYENMKLVLDRVQILMENLWTAL
jgi:hypothetical protein